MGLTRREFVHSSLAVSLISACPVVGTPTVGQAGSAQRLPLSEFVANPQLLAALRSGVSVMRARDPSDPTSWFFQAAVHAVTDGAVAEALAKDPNVAQVDQDRFWNKCPHSRENSANFLIWHRAYVYYFEPIFA